MPLLALMRRKVHRVMNEGKTGEIEKNGGFLAN
jgi:hypothetical protein